MADKMPAELLEKFKKDREENKAPSGEELKNDKRKSARDKARKAKEMRKKD
jgi:hypothetical protein